MLASNLLLITRLSDIENDREALEVVTAIPGDFDLSGQVGVPDLITWAQNFGTTDAGFELGDANLDSLVGVPDLIVWAQRFGHTASDFTAPLNAVSSATSIPEPSGPALLGLSVLAVFRRHKLDRH
ncbi:MAG: hypothetical protein ACYTGQ_12835 [Planctomycetota bacterium]